MSVFANVKAAGHIEILTLQKVFEDDPFQFKVNLGTLGYRNEKGEPFVLPVVRQAEKLLAVHEMLSKEYLPIFGTDKFNHLASKLVLGSDLLPLIENNILCVQTLSGTGSLRLAAEFLHKSLGCRTFYVSHPTWENHKLLFRSSGFRDSRMYRYWNKTTNGVDIEGMCEDLECAPENSVIVLQACAHNPTGCDLTQEQWKRVVDIIETKKAIAVIDCAYQGLASGDLDRDAWIIRYFARRRLEFFCCVSFAKNVGLYNERVGCLLCGFSNATSVNSARTHLITLIKGMYSNPPAHGARIVQCILSNPTLFEEWKENLRRMSSRVVEMRRYLREKLEKFDTSRSWEFLTRHVGMFSYSGLTEQQSMHMVYNHHIYILRSGRINMCGVNNNNIDYVARAIYETVSHIPAEDA